jgi:aryl-alcohol dehydrogenase-like predicted oxidoreductase
LDIHVGVSLPIAGFATPDGTRRYRDEALGKQIDVGHFRTFDSLSLSSLGVGTYLGDADSETDSLVEEAVYKSVITGAVNVIDTAINYRFQKAERAIGRALGRLAARDRNGRERFLVCTKNGYLTSDADITADFWSYIQKELIRPGKLKVEEIAGDVHAMSTGFLRDQFERSLRNLGVETLDLMYLHNAAESWLPEIGYRRFLERLADVFSYYEKERAKGRLRYYGLATWTCFRVPRGETEHLNLHDVVDVARNAGGEGHGFRFIQLPFNPAMNEALILKNQRMADEHLTTFEAAHRLGIGVVTSAPFGEGRLLNHPKIPKLSGSRALSLLQFARSASPVVIAPLVGQKDPQHVKENLRIAEIPPLTAQEFTLMYGPLLEQA